MFLIPRKKENFEMDYKVINNLRGLSIDMINNAKSGHPGICLGAAAVLYTLFSRHLSFNRKDLDWINRDRFILSAGHGAPLLYSIMYMLDILTMEDIKSLRVLNSKTPGHPEVDIPFVEMTTGPLGQGVASSVGMAISEAHLNATMGNIIDHYTYVLAGDGDLMEGVSYEALALAGKLNLNKLIILYDSNDVTLDGDLDKSSIEDVNARFKAINFDVHTVDGDSVREIDNAITKAKKSDRPSIIICKTVIGKYSENEGSNVVHGKPLSTDDISNIKTKLDLYDSPFTVSMDAATYLTDQIDARMNLEYKDWKRRYNNLKESRLNDLKPLIDQNSKYEMENIILDYEGKSLRDLSNAILNEVANKFPLLIGGSADLSSSCKTNLSNYPVFDKNNYRGRNIYFGIREHAMGSILNGMALSGLRPFGSTFLVFSDYLRPAIRMSALMNLPVIYIFTHDSITVGEDGKTHQPIEQLASLELIPNLYVYRPFDVNELIASYKDILENSRPSVLVLPRDNKEISELTKGGNVNKGAYILKKEETDDYIVLLSNGEELGLTIKVSEELKSIGIDSRIVSIPCPQLYYDNPYDFNPDNKEVYAITYGVPDYYYRFTKNVIGIESFGASAKKEDVLENFGFTSKIIVDSILNKGKKEEDENEKNINEEDE
jgi:transketolase